jgi:hypothetical protein
MTNDNFCFYLQNRLIQTSQTGGQWYSDTSPFSIPCINLPPDVPSGASDGMVALHEPPFNPDTDSGVRGLLYDQSFFYSNLLNGLFNWLICHQQPKVS